MPYITKDNAGHIIGTFAVQQFEGQEFIEAEVELWKNPAQQIADLERTITNRRLREAVLGADGGWLANVEAQIAALRSQI